MIRCSANKEGISMQSAYIASGILTLVLLLPGTVQSQSCGCEVSDRKEAAYNALLILDSTERGISAATHLPFGIPVTTGATNERLLHNEYYVINFDEDLHVPTWVAVANISMQTSDNFCHFMTIFRQFIILTTKYAA